MDRLQEALNARIDTTRTQVQLQLDRQRLRALAAERGREKLRLGRLFGLPPGQDFSIADDFPYAPLAEISQGEAMSRACRNRSDLQAAPAAVRTSGEALKAALRQRRAETADIRGRIDQDVRQAFIDLLAAADQVEVTRSNVDLADDMLRQARDRFVDGIAAKVGVVQAQQAVEQTHHDYIAAVFDHNLAKVSLARATGGARQAIARILPRK